MFAKAPFFEDCSLHTTFTFHLICVPFRLNFGEASFRNDLRCSPRCKGMLSLPVQILIVLDYLGLVNNVSATTTREKQVNVRLKYVTTPL